MRITRLITGEDGRSHFEEVELLAQQLTPAMARITLPGVKGVSILSTTPEYSERRDPTPHKHPRQYIITLAGAMEVSLQDGSTRVFGPGDIFTTEDTEGEAHGARVLGDATRIALYLDMDDEA
jgi:quercetin dioxygenase-like cupin family protein